MELTTKAGAGAVDSGPGHLVDPVVKSGGLRTFTGRKIYPLKPRVEDIDILDIAHALSNLCRFAGHVREFYSVAQHSYLVSVAVSKWTAGSDRTLMRWGLMHDAAEAYLVDVPSPLKRMAGFGDGYRAAEKKLLRVIARKFHLSPIAEPEDVRWYDHILLCTEQRDLYANREEAYVPSYNVPMLPEIITAWSPKLAEEMFLAKFVELFPDA